MQKLGKRPVLDMARRTRIGYFAFPVGLLLLAGSLCCSWGLHRQEEEFVERRLPLVTEGMTASEVVKVLGRPSKTVERSSPSWADWMCSDVKDAQRDMLYSFVYYSWPGHGGTANYYHVCLGANDRVIDRKTTMMDFY